MKFLLCLAGESGRSSVRFGLYDFSISGGSSVDGDAPGLRTTGTLPKAAGQSSGVGEWRSSSVSDPCGDGSAQAAALGFQESGLPPESGVLRPRGSSRELEQRCLVTDPVSVWTPAE
ncbi:hypothetical protein Bca4012_056454 [Brassica carinata]